jgi:uncharacterized SAM-binding protein YcdF (DUF218 family)
MMPPPAIPPQAEDSLFFALSKTLGVMALPTNFMIGLGMLGALLCATRWAWFGRRLMIAAFVLLAVCAYSPLGNLLLYPLESRFPPWTPAGGAPDGIIMLGGSIDADLSAAHGTPVVRSAADRIIAGALLARRYPNARVVFTGGSADLIFDEAREADFASTIFEGLGIDKSRLIMERSSRNTYENAIFTRDLLQPKPGEHWLLVTSAFHMPRSVGLFRKAGFPVEAYPVDWHVGRSTADILSFTQFAHEGLSRTDIGMREWMGLVAYWLRGRIDSLLPGPETK